MTFLDVFVIVTGIVLLAVYGSNRWRDVAIVKSAIDGREYVVRKAADQTAAADMLAKLNQKALRLIESLRSKYPSDGRVSLLSQRFNPNALSEGSHEEGYTSYSINKGQRIVMCIRSRVNGDRKPGALEDLNTVTYVMLHELAHLATAEVGHTPVFWKNFKFVVKEAVAIGIYVDKDYSEDPVQYCGITIDSSAVMKKRYNQVRIKMQHLA